MHFKGVCKILQTVSLMHTNQGTEVIAGLGVRAVPRKAAMVSVPQSVMPCHHRERQTSKTIIDAG